ncbi:MAG: UDP-N-acetylmuramoyl-L-alanine--D-glutamate ligase [Candidatus Harrisonbacteria bacterium]|nr:UDP-N-acetylmuramoyl-L-alanine--D-glutamate ligase [Candidatus Harrisonbacteria bacterium]
MNKISNQVKIAIVGWGREGQSVGKFLLKRLKGSADIVAYDTRPSLPKGAKLKGIGFRLGQTTFQGLKDFDLIVRTPTFPYLRKEFQEAKKSGVALTSPTNLFFAELSKRKGPVIIGVTGTKGKGTTSSLIYSILKSAKKKVLLAGNIGLPMLDILEQAKRSDYLILELSSFQLQDILYSPDFAVILPISPDHLDHHKSMTEYVSAKKNLVRYQNPKNAVVYFADNRYSKDIANLSKGKKLKVAKHSSLLKQSDLHILGKHNYRNALAAAQAAKALGISQKTIREGVRSFKGLPYRLQLVRRMRHKGKTISFINDSMSTNPTTAVAAISAMTNPTIWIAGGRSKSSNYGDIAQALKNSTVKAVLLFGENKGQIRKALQGIEIYDAKNLEAALAQALQFATDMPAKELNILFSPASASFDMFTDAYERGEHFTALSRKI